MTRQRAMKWIGSAFLYTGIWLALLEAAFDLDRSWQFRFDAALAVIGLVILRLAYRS